MPARAGAACVRASEPAAADHGEARAQHRDVLDDVRREQHDAVLGELGEQVVEAQPLLGVEPGGRLVDDDEARIAGDRLRDAEPLAHAARVGLDRALAPRTQVHALEQLGRAARFRPPRRRRRP